MAILFQIPTAQRQFVSFSDPYTIPVDAVGTLKLSITVPNSDLTDPTKSINLQIQVLAGDGVWEHFGAIQVQCGPHHNPTSPNFEGIFYVTGAEPLRGRQVRAWMENAQRIRIGGMLELI